MTPVSTCGVSGHAADRRETLGRCTHKVGCGEVAWSRIKGRAPGNGGGGPSISHLILVPSEFCPDAVDLRMQFFWLCHRSASTCQLQSRICY